MGHYLGFLFFLFVNVKAGVVADPLVCTEILWDFSSLGWGSMKSCPMTAINGLIGLKQLICRNLVIINYNVKNKNTENATVITTDRRTVSYMALFNKCSKPSQWLSSRLSGEWGQVSLHGLPLLG